MAATKSYRSLDGVDYTGQVEAYFAVSLPDPLVDALNYCLDTGPCCPSGESRYCKVHTLYTGFWKLKPLMDYS
jgi:hypothetical protein